MRQSSRGPALRRLFVAVVALVAGYRRAEPVGRSVRHRHDVPGRDAAGTCRGPQDAPETDIQGRVPQADYTTGRCQRGYRCNTVEVATKARPVGSRCSATATARATSARSTTRRCCSRATCSFNASKGLGVVVLDMNDPAHPKKTANLTSLAMLSPHESLLLNQQRGLLGACSAPRHQHRHLRPLRREDRLPAPATLSTHTDRPARARERLRQGRQDVLLLQCGGLASRRSTSPTRASRGGSSPSTASTTTACGCPTTATPCTSPTSAQDRRRQR